MIKNVNVVGISNNKIVLFSNKNKSGTNACWVNNNTYY